MFRSVSLRLSSLYRIFSAIILALYCVFACYVANYWYCLYLAVSARVMKRSHLVVRGLPVSSKSVPVRFLGPFPIFRLPSRSLMRYSFSRVVMEVLVVSFSVIYQFFFLPLARNCVFPLASFSLVAKLEGETLFPENQGIIRATCSLYSGGTCTNYHL